MLSPGHRSVMEIRGSVIAQPNVSTMRLRQTSADLCCRELSRLCRPDCFLSLAGRRYDQGEHG